jgi:Dolichyl-phosphate-mannose-protein mannosyltransferase
MDTEQGNAEVETLPPQETGDRDTHGAQEGRGREESARRMKTMVLCLTIFAVAFGVRFLSWHDTRGEVWKVQTVVAEDYRNTARILQQGGLRVFLSRQSPLADPNTLGHPPGYSIVQAIVFNLFGESDARVQVFQIACDALAAVILFLLVAGLLPRGVALTAGLLVALSPQFAWNSVLLLPDTLSVLPLLLAVYCLSRAGRRPKLLRLAIAGACVGLSCWLRANAMLLAPFLLLAVPLLFERGRRLSSAAALLGGALLVIAPLTLRNAIVFGHFIPLSLGAGQTFLEGIADYDTEKRFGIPETDMGIMRMEAEMYNRPDYYGTLFNPDGIKRERLRLAQGFRIALSHPLWFSGVMARRGASMLRLERVRLTSTEPPVTHSLLLTDESAPVWAQSPAQLLSGATERSAQAHLELSPDAQWLRLVGDDSRYGVQLSSAPTGIHQDTDYVLLIPVRVERGRASLSVEGKGHVYGSAFVETMEGKLPEEQPVRLIQLPFVSGSDAELIQIRIANGASKPDSPILHVGSVKLYELGPASYLWTRYPRTVLRAAQRLFLTAVILPLNIIGIVLLVRARRYRALLILLIVPAYFVCVQSATHTEYRYVLAVHYFLFVMTAVTLSSVGGALWQQLRKAGFFRRFSG